MAARRPGSTCLVCQFRQALIGRRRPNDPGIKRQRQRRTMGTMGTMAVSTTGRDTEVVVHESRTVTSNKRKRTADDTQPEATTPFVVSVRPEQPRRTHIDNAVPDLSASLHSLEQLWQERDQRLKVLRNLSNPWPPPPRHRQHRERSSTSSSAPATTTTTPDVPVPPELPSADAAPVPHHVFRQRLLAAKPEKPLRHVLRAQLLHCETPREIHRVVATALVHGPATRNALAALHEPLMRALYRCRISVSDAAVLACLTALRARFATYNLIFPPSLLTLAVKFAARARSLPAMKSYLRALRHPHAHPLTPHTFRALIAKFSIGRRGLGEIRNGRWRRPDLLQVLLGFQNCAHLPRSEQYHLETFLDRTDWQYLHGWIAVLARCRATEALWHEWQLWKSNVTRLYPRSLASPHRYNTTRLRGDSWFIEQMTHCGALQQAWTILGESGISYTGLNQPLRDRLLEAPEFAPKWLTAVVIEDLQRKCGTELLKLEGALGIRWIASEKGEAEGRHECFEEREQVLERLAGTGFDRHCGFPYDEGELAAGERSLHCAEEVGGPESEEGKEWVKVKMQW
ncbi:hypothetical protein B0A50_07875 [Salinomyces thailandicus]|uniref:Uncharacterized protein n=1 Tax=Salinomyces thailandicus TaxID=706561 RepID=A0A4U0TLF6_9PEZI|nr:hypothetical protein B0A50_07875 [Salinomyces thailandica]